MIDPLFILGPPRSFTSVISAALGQHPQMYGLPEVHLFVANTLAEWWDQCAQSTFPMADGLVRAVAQLYFGEQSERTVKLARGWLRRRSHFSTGIVLEMLAERVAPLMLVEKSPSTVYRPEWLRRCYCMFPQARFIHLVRHPRGQGESVMKAIRDKGSSGPAPHWLVHLASYPDSAGGQGSARRGSRALDPQNGWYALHMNICAFLRSVPSHQSVRIRGEELLADLDKGLPQIAAWLGLRTDFEAVEAMKHPERSLYARPGPSGAAAGNDFYFLESPALRPVREASHCLEGPLGWRQDGAGFLPEVKKLAREFGYE